MLMSPAAMSPRPANSSVNSLSRVVGISATTSGRFPVLYVLLIQASEAAHRPPTRVERAAILKEERATYGTSIRMTRRCSSPVPIIGPHAKISPQTDRLIGRGGNDLPTSGKSRPKVCGGTNAGTAQDGLPSTMRGVILPPYCDIALAQRRFIDAGLSSFTRDDTKEGSAGGAMHCMNEVTGALVPAPFVGGLHGALSLLWCCFSLHLDHRCQRSAQINPFRGSKGTPLKAEDLTALSAATNRLLDRPQLAAGDKSHGAPEDGGGCTVTAVQSGAEKRVGLPHGGLRDNGPGSEPDRQVSLTWCKTKGGWKTS